jgi:hypothetical protein
VYKCKPLGGGRNEVYEEYDDGGGDDRQGLTLVHFSAQRKHVLLVAMGLSFE